MTDAYAKRLLKKNKKPRFPFRGQELLLAESDGDCSILGVEELDGKTLAKLVVYMVDLWMWKRSQEMLGEKE